MGSFLGDLGQGLKGLGDIRSPADAFDKLGRFVSGPGADQRAEGLLDNEFRDVNQANFQDPGLAGAIGQRGAQGQQLLGRQIEGINSAPGIQAQQAAQQGQFGQGLLNQFQGRGPGQDLARQQAFDQQDFARQGLLSQSLADPRQQSGRAALLANAQIGQGAQRQAVLGGLQAQVNAGGLLGANIRDQNSLAFQNAQLGQNNQQFNARQQLDQGRLQQQGLTDLLGLQNQLFQQSNRARQAAEAQRGQRFNTIGGQAAEIAKLPTATEAGIGFFKDAVSAASTGGTAPPGAGGAGGLSGPQLTSGQPASGFSAL